MSIFAVDLLSLLYISWLGDPKLTAAVGLPRRSCFFGLDQHRISIAIGALFRGRTARAIAPAQGGLRLSSLVHVF